MFDNAFFSKLYLLDIGKGFFPDIIHYILYTHTILDRLVTGETRSKRSNKCKNSYEGQQR